MQKPSGNQSVGIIFRDLPCVVSPSESSAVDSPVWAALSRLSTFGVQGWQQKPRPAT